MLAEVVACEYRPTKESIVRVLISLGGSVDTDLEEVAKLMLGGGGEEIKDLLVD